MAAGDYEVDFPKNTFATRNSAVTLGVGPREAARRGLRLRRGHSADVGTRLLIGRLLSVDSQILATLHDMKGEAPIGGLPTPLDTEQAGDVLDKLLTVPGSPGGG